MIAVREEPLEGTALDQLQAVAALGGPFVQRVLGVSDDGRAVTYEFLSGPRQAVSSLDPRVAVPLSQVHARLVSSGQVRPGGEARVFMTAAGPVLPVVELDPEP